MAAMSFPQGGKAANRIKVKVMNTQPQTRVRIEPPKRLKKFGLISVLVALAHALRINCKMICMISGPINPISKLTIMLLVS